MINRIKKLSHWEKTLIVIIYDFIVANASLYLAFAIRHERLGLFEFTLNKLITLLLVSSLSQITIFYIHNLYRGVLRYSSTNDLVRLIKAVTVSIPACLVMLFVTTRLESIPRSIFFIDWLLLIVLMGGGRLLYRLWRDYDCTHNTNIKTRNKTLALIIGAGSAGERLHREIKSNPQLQIEVVGYLDDSMGLKGKSIHNRPVLGTIDQARKIIEKLKIKKVFIAIPSATSEELKRAVDQLSDLDIEIQTLPKMSDILNGNIELSSLRKIKIEDLLGRNEVSIDPVNLSKMLKNKRILITGAGGSIGSELCMQLANFSPSLIIAIDNSELNCYQLNNKLNENFSKLDFEVLVGDVRDQDFLDEKFLKEKPDVVFHAAAYKHVPMMEFNPYQAINTNVSGTKNICEIAIKHKVKRFVLVSTDKAVNPTNVMGASKRIAELTTQYYSTNQQQSTKCMIVRFGNVLGSSGSVIPLFRKQIRNGQAVTVTHEQVTRYFMSIAEAARLVLQAGSMGKGSELFVLDMGKPVKILDLAREMINLAGKSDLTIDITGLRPGEKLYEEPLMDSEPHLKTDHSKVFVAEARPINIEFEADLKTLLSMSSRTPRSQFIAQLAKMLPEYKPYIDKVSTDPSKSLGAEKVSGPSNSNQS